MAEIELTLIEQDLDLQVYAGANAILQDVLAGTLEYYKVIGFNLPWVSYLAKSEGEYVGCCSFKGRPANNKVEIAYFTFPPFEGRGVATEMCRQLTVLALMQETNIIVTARTLPEENASTAVLKKNGYTLSGTVNDPDDGEVFEWVYGD